MRGGIWREIQQRSVRAGVYVWRDEGKATIRAARTRNAGGERGREG